MKVLSSLRKRTANGVSVWCFCYDAEMRKYFAVGGETTKVIPADDKAHLQEIYRQFTGYGYTRKLPKPAVLTKPYISDPWQSELPSEMQQHLELLSA